MVLFKQKAAYEMRISDWSSDVCSSDLPERAGGRGPAVAADRWADGWRHAGVKAGVWNRGFGIGTSGFALNSDESRSEEHTSELQSLMRISYAVFCLKKKKMTKNKTDSKNHTTRQ